MSCQWSDIRILKSALTLLDTLRTRSDDKPQNTQSICGIREIRVSLILYHLSEVFRRS